MYIGAPKSSRLPNGRFGDLSPAMSPTSRFNRSKSSRTAFLLLAQRHNLPLIAINFVSQSHSGDEKASVSTTRAIDEVVWTCAR